MNQRVPQSNPDLVELEIANYLPKIGLYNQNNNHYLHFSRNRWFLYYHLTLYSKDMG